MYRGTLRGSISHSSGCFSILQHGNLSLQLKKKKIHIYVDMFYFSTVTLGDCDFGVQRLFFPAGFLMISKSSRDS